MADDGPDVPTDEPEQLELELEQDQARAADPAVPEWRTTGPTSAPRTDQPANDYSRPTQLPS